MDHQFFWACVLFTAVVGTWLWNEATAALSGPLTPLLNFAAGFAVAGAAVLLARRAAKLVGEGKSGKN